ncbi:MAG: NADH-quinone oxidoreductase subunit H [Candidatus Daviesbacteria bacterium]|nr:NADH-quinone oxidoreductase subunit H [Candidatus Daviesbacteria bacterium]
METILFFIIQIILIPLISPFFIGLTRKVKARMQNRTGASPFQPYKDLWKLFHKDEVISVDASWIFKAAPYIIFSTTIIIGASIPLITTLTTNSYMGDFLVIVYLIALGTFFLALAGLDTGGAFGGFASSREMVVSALTEGGLILSLLILALISHSTNLTTITSTISSLSYLNFAPVILAFLSFIISILAENNRYPFDNPATHLELTMIHEAMILEYSGKKLALMEWASANKYLIFIALGVNLFIPWGIATSLNWVTTLTALVIFLTKVSVFCILIATLESSIAKLRFFKLPSLLFTSLVFCIIALGLII